MKTLIFIFIALFFANYVNAQKIKESEVPKAVVSAFQLQFKGAKVKVWEKENGKFEVEFVFNKKESSANFSADGKLIDSEIEIQTSELSKTVNDYVAKNYVGYKIVEASKITDAEGKITFEAEVLKVKEKLDLIFDDKGNFIKKKIEAHDNKEDKD